MRARQQAAFCLLTGQSVEVYRNLTRVERDEFIRLVSKSTDDE